MSSKSISVIGAGLAGLSAAAVLGKRGHEVHIFEKNEDAGGRVRRFKARGFTFDMGPSWYWMPDVMERFFNRFDRSASDFFELKRLDPGFRVYFGTHDYLDIPDNKEALTELFEELEPGSAKKLRQFLRESRLKYEVGVQDLVYKPSISIAEFLSISLGAKMLQLKALQSFDKYVRSFFKHERLISLMEFPILFLGGTAKNTPSLYSLMNYACFELGTWYPDGGLYKLAEALRQVALEHAVHIHLSTPVSSVISREKHIHSIRLNGAAQEHSTQGVINSGDYHFFEQHLLPPESRSYSSKYWESRVMSPSSLIFYLGIDKKVDGLLHHNLFFDEDFGQHAKEIYEEPQWPSKPLFYICCPSKTDASTAPASKENVFVLMPLAVSIEDNEELREKYFDLIMQRIEKLIGVNLRENIVYKRSYCLKDFSRDYNSYKGNAYGLANTTRQTAFMKPRMNSKKINNLFHCGQLTVPGPGVPPSIISGQVAATQMNKYLDMN